MRNFLVLVTLLVSSAAVADTFPNISTNGAIRFGGGLSTAGVLDQTADRGELRFNSCGDAYSDGSCGAGMQIYSNVDPQHDGNFAVLTGPNDKGDGRLIVSGWSNKTHVTIGQPDAVEGNMWDWIDDHRDTGMLNLYQPSGQPAMYIVGAAAEYGEIAVEDGGRFSLGHWGGGDFKERIGFNGFGAFSVNGGAGIMRMLHAEATLDFPAIAAGKQATLNMAAPGAIAGDIVNLGLLTPVAGATYDAWVGTNGAVSVRVSNIGSASINPPANIYGAGVMGF